MREIIEQCLILLLIFSILLLGYYLEPMIPDTIIFK
jgi:hypothetical protein